MLQSLHHFPTVDLVALALAAVALRPLPTGAEEGAIRFRRRDLFDVIHDDYASPVGVHAFYAALSSLESAPAVRLYRTAGTFEVGLGRIEVHRAAWEHLIERTGLRSLEGALDLLVVLGVDTGAPLPDTARPAAVKYAAHAQRCARCAEVKPADAFPWGGARLRGECRACEPLVVT